MANNTTCLDQPYFTCNIGLILPLVNESIWSTEVRAALYLVGLLWSFMAVSILADTFMCAIEVITSQTTEIKVARPDKEEGFETVQVRVWNDTVANLTLMALGSSAPEILLSIIEIIKNNFHPGELGPGTIVGSASFNLLIIVAVCIVGIPDNESRRINRMKVFCTTALFSLFAYGWLYIVLMVQTPNKIELWEAVVTFSFFPMLVILAFIADKNYCTSKVKDDRLEIELGDIPEETALMKQPLTDDERMKDVVSAFMKALDKPEKISEDDASNIAAIQMQDTMPHSRAWYRVKASRDMFAGQRVQPQLSENLQKVLQAGSMSQISDVTYANGTATTSKQRVELGRILSSGERPTTEIEFDAVSCSVMENCGSVKIIVVRKGDVSKAASVKYETIDGTANAGEDYVAAKGLLTFQAKETRRNIEIEIVDDNVWEPDETFFVKLSLPDSDANKNDDSDYVVLGRKLINQITIINDDEPGTVEFTKPSYLVKESVGTAYMPLQRTNGADGVVEVEWSTDDLTAQEGSDFIGRSGVVIFEHGEDVKNVEIPIVNDHATIKDESFQITLKSASGGAKLGHTQKTIVTIVGDDAFEGLVKRVVAKTHLKLMHMKLGSPSWGEQFVNAMNVNGGDVENATAFDYIMHFMSFGFKVIFSFIPPANIWNGWACFFCALIALIGLTALINDLASIFGCLIHLKPTINAITIVALGTSLPDLFASRSAAMQERYADSSIGNVTGSNSVNVFLGLGLPWLIATIYWKVKENDDFHVPAGSIGFSVALYSICAVFALLTLVIRRYVAFFGKCELGGPKGPKWATGIFFACLWLLYIILSSLQAVGTIAGF